MGLFLSKSVSCPKCKSNECSIYNTKLSDSSIKHNIYERNISNYYKPNLYIETYKCKHGHVFEQINL